MARTQAFLLVSLLSFAAMGCVSTEQAKALQMDRDQYAARLSVAEREKAEAVAARDAYKMQLDNVGLTQQQQGALSVNQANQIADLQRQLAEAKDAYARAAANVGTKVIELPEELNTALKGFAAANPDLVSFDEKQGIVKFKSDVTFDTGSAVLKPMAASAIDKFAGILNSPAAAGYELMVVGHTDNIPVSHQATKAAGHLNNWYLSAHRAIAVSAELQKQSVSSGRLEVAGCADQRPIASNADSSGRAMNRRVEVLILPTTSHGTVAAGTPTGAIPASAHQ
ncbi:MAG TPA: OmpA family protein, partial [Tepidisphaeraceae bacterium]|nr:OmpA family protein [Tepidisphaeraceae bacterium]